MSTTVKRRILDTFPFAYQHNTDNNGVITYGTPGSGTIYSRQITESEGHRWPKGRSVKDVGGPFDTLKMVYTNSYSEVPLDWSYNWQRFSTVRFFGHTTYQTPLLQPNNIWITDGLPDADYRGYVGPSSFAGISNVTGTKLVSMAIPTSPIVDGSVSLAELYREGIPRFVGYGLDLSSKISFFRSLGSEYLNVEFGWKPLVSDLKDAAKAVLESDQILRNLAEHSGKRLYRYRFLPREVNTTVSNVFQANPPGRGSPPTGLQAGNAGSNRTTTTQVDSWFSGEFTYEYDPGSMSTLDRIAQEAHLLYGLELTPETVWNLAPWSWLVDWFANVGPVLSNLAAFQQDGLVMRYGYVMQRYRRTDTLAYRGGKPQNTANFPSGDVIEKYYADRKLRAPANPFGFGIVFDALTNRQTAILTALGLTKI